MFEVNGGSVAQGLELLKIKTGTVRYLAPNTIEIYSVEQVNATVSFSCSIELTAQIWHYFDPFEINVREFAEALSGDFGVTKVYLYDGKITIKRQDGKILTITEVKNG